MRKAMLNHNFHIPSSNFNQWAAVSLSLLSFYCPFDLEIQERWWTWKANSKKDESVEISWWTLDWIVSPLSVESFTCPSAALTWFYLLPAYFLATEAWENSTWDWQIFRATRCRSKGHESGNQASHLCPWLCHTLLSVLGWVTRILLFYFIYRTNREYLCYVPHVKISWNKARENTLRGRKYYKTFH